MNPERWRQIRQIYSSALDQPPERREAFLDEACTGDETLRKEVASLLAEEGRSKGPFDSPRSTSLPRRSPATRLKSHRPSLAPGANTFTLKKGAARKLTQSSEVNPSRETV